MADLMQTQCSPDVSPVSLWKSAFLLDEMGISWLQIVTPSDIDRSASPEILDGGVEGYIRLNMFR